MATTKTTTKKTTTNADETRRDFIVLAASATAGVGAAAAVWPFVDQMNPAADVLALSSVEIDISSIQSGQSITVMWRGKPIFIRRRTQDEITAAREVVISELPDPQEDQSRIKPGKDQWLVMIGVCTHLGCIPLGEKGDYNGWFCPCHGSHYDTSGRIRKGPAPRNLDIPQYEFLTSELIRIG